MLYTGKISPLFYFSPFHGADEEISEFETQNLFIVFIIRVIYKVKTLLCLDELKQDKTFNKQVRFGKNNPVHNTLCEQWIDDILFAQIMFLPEPHIIFMKLNYMHVYFLFRVQTTSYFSWISEKPMNP